MNNNVERLLTANTAAESVYKTAPQSPMIILPDDVDGSQSTSTVDMSFINTLSKRRRQQLTYLSDVITGKQLFYNSVRLNMYSNAQPQSLPSNMRKKTSNWLHFGASIGVLLRIDDKRQLLKALCILLQEFDHYQNDTVAVKQWQQLQGNPYIILQTVSAGPKNYSQLVVNHIPFAIDYATVTHCLCALMCRVYKQFKEMKWPSSDASAQNDYSFFQIAFKKVDAKLKAIIQSVRTDLQQIADLQMQQTINGLTF
ncbi:hypothetical protein MIR68_008078 [Amoeboaphelidium protococcarum]|nr:hypothetical protein MIR68_008078 [Amoeboaphelidium protococcarum]